MFSRFNDDKVSSKILRLQDLPPPVYMYIYMYIYMYDYIMVIISRLNDGNVSSKIFKLQDLPPPVYICVYVNICIHILCKFYAFMYDYTIIIKFNHLCVNPAIFSEIHT
jgi:hypothetical protein